VEKKHQKLQLICKKNRGFITTLGLQPVCWMFVFKWSDNCL